MNVQSWIKDNKALIWTGVVIVLLMIVSNKKNYERFVTVFLGFIDSLGETVLDFSESLLGVLNAVEDFFEALTYVLFGNFSSAIRFIMANYVILFASIVSFLTTLFGLKEILDTGLAIVLSFAIQTVIVLMSLYLAHEFLGEPVKKKKIVEYYLTCYKPILDVPSLSVNVKNGEEQITLFEKCLAGTAYVASKVRRIFCLGFALAFILSFITISSMLTYIYIYDTKLDEYMVYKTAYKILEEVEKDTADNRNKLDDYFKYGNIILNSFSKKAAENHESGKSIYNLIDYLDSQLSKDPEGERNNSDIIFQEFKEKVMESFEEVQDNEGNLSGINVWNGENVQRAECASREDLISLAQNILNLKLYSIEEGDLEDVSSKLEELRKYLVKAELRSESSSENDRERVKQEIRERVYDIILTENLIYAKVPILRDIQIKIPADNGYEIRRWMKPVESSFAVKYEHCLEIVDTKLLVTGRAFDALFSMDNTFIKCMCFLSFIADFLIVFSCIIRTKQEPGKSSRTKQNLVHSIFIKNPPEKPEYNDIAKIVFIISNGIMGLVFVRYIPLEGVLKVLWIMIAVQCIIVIVLKKAYPGLLVSNKGRDSISKGENIIRQILTENSLEILKKIELKKVLKETYLLWKWEEKREHDKKQHQCIPTEKQVFMERQIETARCQEFYIDCNCIYEGEFKKEIILLCFAELAYPVMDEAAQTKGYIITKECIRLLIKELFDEAKKSGLNIRVFKEDLKEYEENIWD